MKIRTQFIITMILFGIILAVIAASAVVTSRKAEKVGEQEKIASSIAQGAGDLSYLTNDYLIYRESQQLKRWQTRFASLSNQVARLNVNKPEQQALVHNIKGNQQRIKEVFESVASAVKRPDQNRSTNLDVAFLQVSWSRMAVQSQGLVSDASRLSQLLLTDIDHLRRMRTLLMYVMVGLFGLFLSVSYMLTYRRILKSIMKLQAGTAVIGFGNLDFIIEEKKNDEIGDLSRAFNKMTTDLKDVTASKADLEREVTQRKQAEENLRRQREWLSVTLSSIGDGVIATDTKGQVTFLNPVAVTLTGWQSEEASRQPIQNVFRIINEKTHQPAEDLVSRVLSEKRIVALANDTALVTKDGREIPIEDSAAPIKDSAGNLIGVVLVFHDVTERRRAQVALREAHERAVWLARFPDQNPNPIIRASADGTVLYCNPASTKLHGWKCEVGQVLQNELVPLVGRAMADEREVQHDIEFEGRFYMVWVAPFPGEGYANIYAHDITARKRAEDALRDAQKRVEADLEAMKRLQKLGTLFLREGNLEAALTEIVDTAIAISGADFGNIQLLDPKSSDLKIAAQRGFPKWWLDFWNSASKGQGACGTAVERGERVIVEDVEHSPIFVGTRALEIQLKAGVRAVQSNPLVSRSGGLLGMFSTHYKAPHRPDDRALQLLDLLARHGTDIIERAQAEEALRENERRLNRAQEIAHLGSWELDVANNRLTWSDEVYRIFGLQPQEFGATYEAFLEAVHPDDRAAVDAAYSGSVREGRDSYEIEHRVVRKSTGETRTVHERCEHIRDASGQIIRSIGMVHDITERKLREQRIVRLTKLYAVLSRVNEAIVRTRDEERLHKEVCRIIAEEGEFPLVWIGQVKERQVAPVASHGPATDYLKDIRVEIDGELGSGPTGTCIREDHSVVNKDFDTNPSTVPWRKPALRYGFRASAAFPIHRQGRVVSALTLYSPEPGAFDTEQVNLLEALCADISYALDAMQEEKLRTEAENALRQRTLELQQLTENLEQRVLQRTAELAEANNALRQLSIRLLSAQEEERKRIAGELHDTIGSCLSGIKFKVESALQEITKTPKAATKSLNTIVPVIQEAVEECRRIQMDLRPSMLDDLGLFPTLSWFFRRFKTIYSAIRVEQEMTVEESELPDSLKIVIYRVIQEAMNNIAKHSHANLVRLGFRKIDDRMELFVEDNGHGFSVQQRLFLDDSRRGLGLTSMRKRTELSGGSFAIESAEGKGTIIRASWPI